jgi:hypothetical protein
MKRSEQINELAASLAKAQKSFEAAERTHSAKVETKTGGSYSFNYADLAAYLDVCRAPLGDNGLSFIQEPVNRGSEVAVTTLLMHLTGQWIESEPLVLKMIPDSRGEFTPQIVGSAITYARRYSLSALIGLASDVDDDGNAASGNRAETGKRAPAPECPACKTNKHVIKGKEEFGGGWLCWKNKGGCGEKWQDAPPPAQAEPEAKEPPPEVAAALAEWREKIDNGADLDAINAILLSEFVPMAKGPVRLAVWNLICETMYRAGCDFDKLAKRWVVKEGAAA